MAGCLGGKPQYEYTNEFVDYCAFTYVSEMPVVTSFNPVNATVGTNITIYGHGFSTEVDDNFVMFGDADCMVTMATNTSLQCTITNGQAGPKRLHLHVLSAGLANTGNHTLQLQADITGVQPAMSGVGGGVDMYISGSGFVSSKDRPRGPHPGYSYSGYKAVASNNCSTWQNRVTVGGVNCPIKSSNETSIVCVVPAGTAGEADLMVTLTCTEGEGSEEMTSLSAGFTYNASLTTTVTSITPSSGSGRGGTAVTITGTGFSVTPSGNAVMV